MLFFLAPFVPDVYPVLYDLSVIIFGFEHIHWENIDCGPRGSNERPVNCSIIMQ